MRLRIFSLTMVILALAFMLEPVYRNKITFAVPFLTNSKASVETLKNGPVIVDSGAKPVQQKTTSSAPEPATIFLMLGGISGIVVRFAKKGFEQIKRAIDIVLSVIGLTITSPILIFSAILIKLDSKGPIIYKQIRLGLNNKVFRIYKLRSMRQDAEKGTGAVWASKNDPRVTSLGRILRKSRIDESPQLLNVFRGDMSIVGPRPERPELVLTLKTLINDYEKRLSVKPGITGLAQVLHKYDETIEDVRTKVKYDLTYIQNRNLYTDLRIMAQTFGVVLTGKGAN
jgi:lipopolysaccharide/colanic/teichoic acid biosynthesis glycosyltransferase